jgi:NAD(P)-dependent dehydrogenase (short-subunit alcohol dehydrogenase family)
MELIPFGIDVIVIEPGAIRTEWGGIAHESMLRMSGDTAYGPYARRHAAMFEQVAASRMPSPPEVVAETIGRAVAARRPRTRYPTGGGAKVILFIQRFLTDRMADRLMWRMSQRAR